MNSNDTQPTTNNFADNDETLDPQVRLVPVQSDSSESDSDKENVQPDVPRTVSVSSHEEGEITHLTGETSKDAPNLQERTNQDHPTSWNTAEEEGIRWHRRPPTPFRTTDGHDYTIHGDLPSSRPFSTLYERPDHKRPVTTFERIRTTGEINQRLTFIANTMGYRLAADYQDRLKVLWGLLRDDRIVIAISNRARYVFNWQCAELVEVFANIARMEWESNIHPGSSIEQLGFDVLRRLIAADVERFYKDAIEDVHRNDYGVIPEKEASVNAMFLNHSHPVTTIAPRKQYANEIADLAHDKAKKLNSLCENLIAESKKLIKATKWAQKTYPHGPKPFQHPTETKDLIADALNEVDNLSTYFPTNFPGRMPYARYRPLRRCIHCKGKHDSEDHHLSL